MHGADLQNHTSPLDMLFRPYPAGAYMSGPHPLRL
jgi:hypothetical protein